MAEEKKIIIDEDWKSQVQAEKEMAAKEQPAGAPEISTTTAAAGEPEMPPASFELLVTMLATEALVALGQVPHPADSKIHIQRNQAKYLIDMLDVLRSKTKGNLSIDEEQLIESILHQLRLAYVQSASDSPVSTGNATN